MRVSLFLALAACGPAPSDHYPSTAISAEFVVTSAADGSVARGMLRLGGVDAARTLAVGGSDTLSATDGTDTTTMLPDGEGYSAAFDSYAEDTPFTFGFLRTVDAGAPSSTCTLPPPLTVTAPTSGASFHVGTDAIDVAWTSDGGGDDLHVAVAGDCIDPYDADTDDDLGATTIAAGAIVVTGECDATLTVSRRREGALDPGYGEGGSIRAEQARTVTIAVGE